jgi:hypothetical protein
MLPLIIAIDIFHGVALFHFRGVQPLAIDYADWPLRHYADFFCISDIFIFIAIVLAIDYAITP